MKKLLLFATIIFLVNIMYSGDNLYGYGNLNFPTSYQQNAAKTDNQKSNLTTNNSGEKPDTIVKLGGKKILCDIKKISATSVYYNLPGQTDEKEMLRKDIERVIYKNGRKEIFNKPVLQMVNKDNWQAVVITENEGDVAGLYKVAALKTNAASGIQNPAAAKASATMRLQKKAANIGSLMVLVIHTEMLGGYGEIPGCELEGIAYSDIPPADTAAVNKAIQQMIERRQNSGKKK